jgi:NAD(P)-dependent dehydrogenase (short-subunit alcohol dehydrogenase family)
MPKRLSGKVAIITGAAGGLGIATAALLHEEGARVALVDLGGAALDAALASFGTTDGVIAVPADVTDEDDVRAYVARTVEAFGTVDILFNNAGVEGVVRPIIETSKADFEKVQSVNVVGVFLGLKHVLPVLYAKGRGSVINTSSVGGFSGPPGMSAYVSSKHAVIGLTKVAALEAAKHGVRVNSVHPSAANTRMMRSLEASFAPDDSERARAQFAKAIPLGRYAEPIDIAQLVLFLASDDSAFITGAQYRIDGGQGAL